MGSNRGVLFSVPAAAGLSDTGVGDGNMKMNGQQSGTTCMELVALQGHG